jgi:hypothetical protein
VLKYVQVLAGMGGDDALLSVVNLPFRRLGKHSVDKVRKFAGELRMSVWDALVLLAEHAQGDALDAQEQEQDAEQALSQASAGSFSSDGHAIVDTDTHVGSQDASLPYSPRVWAHDDVSGVSGSASTHLHPDAVRADGGIPSWDRLDTHAGSAGSVRDAETRKRRCSELATRHDLRDDGCKKIEASHAHDDDDGDAAKRCDTPSPCKQRAVMMTPEKSRGTPPQGAHACLF